MYLSESDDAAILGLQFINEIETDINRRRRNRRKDYSPIARAEQKSTRIINRG